MTLEEIQQAHSHYDQQALVLYYGAACAPCQRLKPRLVALAAQHGLRLEQINVAGDLAAAKALGIRGVPSLVAVRAGQAKLLFTGELTDVAIREQLVAAGVL